MDLSSKWVWIGALLVILLIAFGRNPVEEGRQRRVEKMRGKDPLVYSIEQHNKVGNSRFSGDRLMGRTSKMGAPAPGAENVTPRRNNTNNFGGFTQPVAPVAPQNQQAPGYYPPPPDSDPNSPPPNPNAPRSDNSPFHLQDGRPYSFYGTKMYTVDASGRQVQLPDGKYPIAGGKLQIIIENGEKVGISR